MQTCTQCAATKPLDEYYDRVKWQGGKHRWCEESLARSAGDALKVLCHMRIAGERLLLEWGECALRNRTAIDSSRRNICLHIHSHIGRLRRRRREFARVLGLEEQAVA